MTEEGAPAELEELRRAPLPVEPLAKSASRRAALWPGFQSAFVRARPDPVRKTPVRAIGVGLLLAGALIAGSLFVGRTTTNPSPAISTVAVPTAGPATVAELAVADGEATVRLVNGVAVTATIDSMLTFDEIEPRVDLGLGVGRFVVPKLPAPDQFSVHTPDARVVVHGTDFVVSVRLDNEHGGTVTSVSVREGVVSVHHQGGEAVLGAGESWSSAEQRAPAPVSASASPPVPAIASASAVTVPTSKPSEQPTSTLTEENALFEKAMAARKAGNDAEVVRLLDAHRRKYPTSPLGPVVERERERAMERAKQP
ncbi:MAG: FecR domain-containing protein [Polyangiaceae bacterium]|nr:FecR domain-containing protein [Polyangiaceae bacterium]